MSAALACLLVLGACSDGGDPEQVVLPTPSASAEAPAGDPSPEPSPTASAEAPDDPSREIDVTTIPDEVTPAYVEAVYAAINASRIAYDRAVLSEPVNGVGALPTGTRAGIERWLTGTQLRAALAGLEAFAESEAAREGIRPADQVTGFTAEVERIVAADQSCIVAIARLDDSGIRVGGGPQDVLVALSFSPNETTSETENPTLWKLRDQLRNEGADGERNPDAIMLDADLKLLETSLDTTCTGGD